MPFSLQAMMICTLRNGIKHCKDVDLTLEEINMFALSGILRAICEHDSVDL
jgi:hypothetical protein